MTTFDQFLSRCVSDSVNGRSGAMAEFLEYHDPMRGVDYDSWKTATPPEYGWQEEEFADAGDPDAEQECRDCGTWGPHACVFALENFLEMD
jgi:hypothetical protein